MRERVFEAYLEDGEELLWEGFYSCATVSIRDFDSTPSLMKKIELFSMSLYLRLIIGSQIGTIIIFFHLTDLKFSEILLGFTLSTIFVILWQIDNVIFLRQLQYERGQATQGLTYAVTSRRLLAYDFASKRVFRELHIHSKLTAIPAVRGVSIDASRATAWVWPLDRTSADEATRVIREARDRMKAEAA